MKTITILLLLIIPIAGIGQTIATSADTLRKEGKLEVAIEAYKATYSKDSTNWKNTYNLACAYALIFQKDSAYHYLSIALKQDTSLWALADSDLYALIDDPRWLQIENEQVKRFEQNHKKLKQPEYAKKLLNIILKDQAMDYYVNQAKKHYMKEGSVPQWYYPIGAFKRQIGKKNYTLMTQFIETYGWPTYSTVGKLAADAPLLVINHHEDPEVRKKHIAQIKRSCLNNEGSCLEFARIQDRILVNEDRPQIYGTQFQYNAQRNLEPCPIIDPEYVDQRRKEIGLEGLKEYLKRKINYDFTIDQKRR